MTNHARTIADLRAALTAKDSAIAAITVKIESLIGEVKALRKRDAAPVPVPRDPAATRYDTSEFLTKAATLQGTIDRLAADVAALEHRYAGEARP